MVSGFIPFEEEKQVNSQTVEQVERLKQENIWLKEEIECMSQKHYLEVYALKKQIKNQST